MDKSLGLNDPSLDSEEMLPQVLSWFRPFQKVIVAFSGGVDSSLVLKLASMVHGPKSVRAVLADSASLSRREFRAAHELATSLGISLDVLFTQETNRPEYQRNSGDRCYYCKQSLYSELETALAPLLASRDTVVVDGTNGDDLHDQRPGLRAAAEFAIRHPLAELGLGKDQVRGLARSLHLPNWNKPASPCLSSRVPVGTRVDEQLLALIERAEDGLHDLGLDDLRVRVHHGHGEHEFVARIELSADNFLKVQQSKSLEAEVIQSALRAGFSSATIDPQGYRRGGANSGHQKLALAPDSKNL